MSDGWDWVQAQQVRHPLYWVPDDATDAGWRVHTPWGIRALQPALPVMNLCWYEADAYARWRGARLPTEAQWEAAAAAGLLDGVGQAWEWTESAFRPYPGFAPDPGAVGEYNGKFMINQMVLRGGSIATPAGHARPAYRNFFPPGARWQFSGLRLVADA
jgi:formylglycine-generating enzyme required for sulfatase activity